MMLLLMKNVLEQMIQHCPFKTRFKVAMHISAACFCFVFDLLQCFVFVSSWIASGLLCFVVPHLQVCNKGWGASSHLHVVLPGNLLCKANDCSGNMHSLCDTSFVMTVFVAAWANSTLMAIVCAMLVSHCASSPDGTCLCHVCFTNL
jgi:hypothetical protein